MLNELDIFENKIGPTGAAAIADALKGNEVLKSLFLDWNHIGDEGAKAIGGALAGSKYTSRLTRLSLGHCDLGDYGAVRLGWALEENVVLTWLNLQENNIGVEGAEAIGGALAVNRVLTSLDLSSNKICGIDEWDGGAS